MKQSIYFIWDRLCYLLDERLGDWLEEKIENYPRLSAFVASLVVFGTMGLVIGLWIFLMLGVFFK